MGRGDLDLVPFRDVVDLGLGGPGLAGRVDADGLVADPHRAVLLEVSELATGLVAALDLGEVGVDPGLTTIGSSSIASVPVSRAGSWR